MNRKIGLNGEPAEYLSDRILPRTFLYSPLVLTWSNTEPYFYQLPLSGVHSEMPLQNDLYPISFKIRITTRNRLLQILISSIST